MQLKVGDKIRITGFQCGHCCSDRFSCMGILIGKTMTIKSIHPFRGPIVVDINQSEYTIGRGMFEKIEWEKLDEE